MKSDFQKVKTEQIRAFVPEELQSVERQDVLRTASDCSCLIIVKSVKRNNKVGSIIVYRIN